MNNILSLSKDFKCLCCIIHYQCGVSVEDLFDQDLDGILRLGDDIFESFNINIPFFSALQILIRNKVCLFQHLLKYLIILTCRRRKPHLKYLFMSSIILDQVVEESETEERDLVITLLLDEGNDHGPEEEFNDP